MDTLATKPATPADATPPAKLTEAEIERIDALYWRLYHEWRDQQAQRRAAQRGVL